MSLSSGLDPDRKSIFFHQDEKLLSCEFHFMSRMIGPRAGKRQLSCRVLGIGTHLLYLTIAENDEIKFKDLPAFWKPARTCGSAVVLRPALTDFQQDAKRAIRSRWKTAERWRFGMLWSSLARWCTEAGSFAPCDILSAPDAGQKLFFYLLKLLKSYSYSKSLNHGVINHAVGVISLFSPEASIQNIYNVHFELEREKGQYHKESQSGQRIAVLRKNIWRWHLLKLSTHTHTQNRYFCST